MMLFVERAYRLTSHKILILNWAERRSVYHMLVIIEPVDEADQ